MLLVFSYEHSRPKAVAPLLAWGGSILVGMIAEEAVSMGIKWGSKKIGKKKADEWAAELWKNGEDFDFAKANPYLNKDGSVAITPSARDRAKVASFLAGVGAGLVTENILSEDKNTNGVPIHGGVGGSGFVSAYPTSDPFHRTEIGLILKPERQQPADLKAYDMVRKLFNIEVEPVPFMMGSKVTFISTVDPDEKMNIFRYTSFSRPLEERLTLQGGEIYEVRFASYPVDPAVKSVTIALGASTNSDVNTYYTRSGVNIPITLKAYDEYIKALALSGKKLYFAQGLVIPETIGNVYQYPNNTVPKNYEIPNKQQLENKPIIIPNLMPPGNYEGEITWGDIEENYDNSETVTNIVNIATDAYLENGDINNTTYNTTIINNYYTDIGQDKTKEEVLEEIEKLPVEVPDGDNLPVPVDPVDRSLLVVAKESYQYLADTVKSSVDGLTAVTAGATGLITFLGTTMGWLPDEWIVMFSAAFGLGLFAFFFRR